MVSNWSGHLDFLKKDAVTLIKGRLTEVPKDAFPEDIYQDGAQWFTCDYNMVKKVYVKDQRFMRPSEVPYLLGNSSLAKKELNWRPEYNWKRLLKEMYENDLRLLSEKIQ